MKRLCLMLSLLLCALLLPAASFAQSGENELAACLNQRYPGFEEAAYDQWGNTAAAVFSHNGRKILCLNFRGYRYAQRTGSIMSQGDPRNYLDRSEYLLDWTACFAARGDTLRAEGLLNDAIENLAEKDRFDLSTPAQQQRYRTACRACADAYRDLAQRTGRRSMLLRAALLRLGLPVYQAFLKHKA